jgi:hypothetical protein
MEQQDLIVKIDEAGKLDKIIKANTLKLKDLKKELGAHFESTGSKKELGDKYQAVFSVTPRYSDIDPVEVHKVLEAKGLGGKLLEIVKIQVTPLKSFLSGVEIDGLREKVSEVINVKLDILK